MIRVESKIVPIKKHKRNGSKFECSSYLAEQRGQLLICLCCGNSEVEQATTYDESVVKGIRESGFPPEIFIHTASSNNK